MRCTVCFVVHPPHVNCRQEDRLKGVKLRADHGGQVGAMAWVEAQEAAQTPGAPKPTEVRVPEKVMLRPVMLPAEEKEAPQGPVTLPDVILQQGEMDEFLEFKRRLRLANRDRVRKHRAKKAAEKKNEPSS